MNLKKKLWRLLSVLSTLLLVILPITGCDSSFSTDSTTETGTYFSVSETTEYENSNARNNSQQKSNLSGSTEKKQIDETDDYLDKNGSYTSKEDIMHYLIQYGHLPDNFITKKEAKKLGWTGGSLESYAPGKCIGGDYFGNYEELLPVVSGRTYHECDIDTLNKTNRGAKRIIYSDDGQIYYTEDHYKTFTLLYGDDVQ